MMLVQCGISISILRIMTDDVSIMFIDVMLVLVDPRCAGEILCFGLDPLHVCSELRVLVGH